MIETFRKIVYSNKNSFKIDDERISLKEYQDNLIFYSSFDSILNADYYQGNNSPETNGNVYLKNTFGSQTQQVCIENGGYLKYDKSNFEKIINEGTFSFFIKPEFLNGKGYQYFNNDTFSLNTMPYLDNEYMFGGKSLNLTTGPKSITYSKENLSSLTQTGTIDFFVKPTEDVPSKLNRFIDISNGIDNNNRITIYNDTNGTLNFYVYDSTGAEIFNISFNWTFNTEQWTNISLNFDINNGANKVFVNGTQYGITSFDTGTRIADNQLKLGTSEITETTNYLIDDLSIFEAKKFSNAYSVRTNSFDDDDSTLIVQAKFNSELNLDIGTTLDYLSTYPENNIYSFRVKVNETDEHDVDIILEPEDSLNDFLDKINIQLTTTRAEAKFFDTKLGIASKDYGGTIEILENNLSNSFIDLLGGVSKGILPNAPSENITIFDFYNEINNNNRITITHSPNSDIIINFFDREGNIFISEVIEKWNNSNDSWQLFELSFNNTIGSFFINGLLKKVFITNGLNRIAENSIFLRAGSTDFYSFEELKVYDTMLYSSNHEYSFEKLKKYDDSNPYIDIHMGNGFKESEVADIYINCSDNCSFSIKPNENWYYWYLDQWIESDGSYSQSTTLDVLETNFEKLYFEENFDLVIRVYFNSNGENDVWVDEIEIETEKTEDYPAIITGQVLLDNPVDLSSDQHVVISTDAGDLEVDLTSTMLGEKASITGTENLSSGYDWSLSNESFEIDTNTIVLDQTTNNLDEIISLIESQVPADTYNFINEDGYLKIESVDFGSSVSFELSEVSGGLSTLGFSEGVVNGEDPDLTNVFLSDIKSAINDAGIPGLAPAASDYEDRLVLMSNSQGQDAYIGISEGVSSNALDIIWGDEDSNNGEDNQEEVFDYSYIFDKIRSKLGAPTVPVELTDEQLRHCVSKAVYWYNYYRSDKKDRIKVFLKGTPKEGYVIPEEIPDENDIEEIIIKPRFPLLYNSSGSTESILNNVWAQTLFRGRGKGYGSAIGDYYVVYSTMQDYSNLFGLDVSWEIYNNRLFIHPEPSDMEVGITFKSAIDIKRINTEPLITSYALGEAKIVLGNIRTTFGGTIPGGAETIQLNGDSLKQEGATEIEAALQQMINLSEPLFLEWG